MVAIPLSFCLFTLASGYITFNLSQYFFWSTTPSPTQDAKGYFWILLAIFIMTGLATLAGVAIAHAVTAPFKRLSSRVESVIHGEAAHTAGPLPSNELDLLSRTLEKVFDSLEHLKDDRCLEVLSEGIIALDKKSKVMQVSKIAEKVLGVNAKDVLGRPFREFFPDPAKYKIFLNLVENALKEGSTNIFVDIEIPTLHPDATGSDKKGPQHLEGRIIPRKDQNDETSGVIIAFRDPSEMEQIKQWLKQADQMAGLGTMATGIAHEIRNPLASIRGLMELVKQDVPPPDPHGVYAEKVIKEVDRMNNLVEEVLEFAHTETAEPVPQDVNLILKEALSSVSHRFPNHQLEVVEKLDSNLPPVLVRPEKLTRAFENLILNAFEATPERGKITITSSNGDRTLINGRTSRKVLLTFHNTGSFIPPEETDKIFLPFYTTKTKGTGLGLPITHRIISSHGGHISVNSDHEKGTTFTIELPTYQ
ncbi:MAG: two-component system sensor histidine kinase NtrB [Candidatus Brocadiales bacterium]